MSKRVGGGVEGARLQREETLGAERVVAARGAVEAVREAHEADRALLGLLRRALVRPERERRETARVHEARDLARVPAPVGERRQHRGVQSRVLSLLLLPAVLLLAATTAAVRACRCVSHFP